MQHYNFATLQHLQPFYNVTLQHCNFSTLRFFNSSTLQLCNFSSLQLCKNATMQHCDFVTLWLCDEGLVFYWFKMIYIVWNMKWLKNLKLTSSTGYDWRLTRNSLVVGSYLVNLFSPNQYSCNAPVNKTIVLQIQLLFSIVQLFFSVVLRLYSPEKKSCTSSEKINLPGKLLPR